MRELLGGKGANVAEMTRVLGADRVPAGFTITTEACVAYMRSGSRTGGAGGAGRRRRCRVSRRRAGKRFGDDEDPLLVSVRSGARESMPGMLDTILNVGLNDTSVAGPGGRHRQRALRLGLVPPARADVRQRRRGRAGLAVRGRDRGGQARRRGRHRRSLPARRAEASSSRSSRASTTSPRSRRSSSAARSSRCSIPGRASARSPTGGSTGSPTTGAPRSTSSRWCSATRATNSATGVAFSRDEVTGAPEPSGDFLVNAQGEDVVSGVRTPARHLRAAPR